jgi:ferredoxin-NADP reductase
LPRIAGLTASADTSGEFRVEGDVVYISRGCTIAGLFVLLISRLRNHLFLEEQVLLQTISNAVLESPNVVTLTIDTPEPFPRWIPGQFLRISMRRDEGWSEEHTFTISSAPGDPVQISVKAIGKFTIPLLTVQPGTEVRIRGPYGTFCKGIEQHPEIIMIAGGIGITPFLSVLKHFSRTGCANRIVLFWASNTLKDIIRREEICNYAHTLNLKIVHALWHADPPAETIPTGYGEIFTQGLLTREIFTVHAPFDTATIYFCGPPPMTEKITGILHGMDIDKSRIFMETQMPPKAPGS